MDRPTDSLLRDPDNEKPSVARVYDFYLGGTANYAVDREFGTRVLEKFPLLRPIAVANRQYLHRVVRYLAGLGVRQFVDVGSGVPTMGNTHQAADEIAPESKVVYLDYEPVAVAHSRRLVEQHGDPARHVALEADLREPGQLWELVAESGVIDVTKPVALLMIAVLHMQQRDHSGREIGPECVAEYRNLLAPGSYLALSHLTDDGVPEALRDKLAELKHMYDTHSSPVIWRSRAEIRALLGDFELLPPGMTWTPEWHPEISGPKAHRIAFDRPGDSVVWAGAGKKPGTN